MFVSQDQSQQITQTQKVAPHLIQASELLQCSSIELFQVVERELMENPALEFGRHEHGTLSRMPFIPSRLRALPLRRPQTRRQRSPDRLSRNWSMNTQPR